ncbi:MAG: DUF3836 domain-containing protein [Tannerellaceae bacterium]|nr:DUF3836 domain-containing protein [Tannerellaceae bacterium]
MKLLQSIPCTLLMLLFLAGSNLVEGKTPRNYVYDTQEENGMIVSKVVYVQDNNLLNKQMKFEFIYNENGKVEEKIAWRWNKTKDEWLPFYRISYTYDETAGKVHSTYGMWDAQKSNYSLNEQQLIFPLSEYEEIFS